MKAPVVYVKKRAELNDIKKLHKEQYGNRVYQTHAGCLCTERQSRKAIIIIDPANEELDLMVIRCKRCRSNAEFVMNMSNGTEAKNEYSGN